MPLPSRILWNTSPPEQPVLVGPRYDSEHIGGLRVQDLRLGRAVELAKTWSLNLLLVLCRLTLRIEVLHFT